jgi:alcohol dehydrogenase class IV
MHQPLTHPACVSAPWPWQPFVSNKANPLVDAVAREGITRASRSLRAAYRFGGDLVAREDMALASVMGGLALANAKLGKTPPTKTHGS